MLSVIRVPARPLLSATRSLVAFVGIVSATACGALVSTDGLTGGSATDAASSVDAPGEAGSGEAGSDSTSADASASPCAVGHLFCNDFEGETALRLGSGPTEWNAIAEETGGRIEVSTARARSGTRSLRATVPRLDAAQSMTATVAKRLQMGTWRPLVVEMEMFIVSQSWLPSDDGNFNVAFTSYEPTPSQGLVGWSLTKRGSGSTQMYTLLPTVATDAPVTVVPENKWVHVRVEWEPAGTGSFIVSADGVFIDRRVLALDADVVPPASGGSVVLNLGIVRYSSGGNWPTPPLEIFIDDVVADVR